MSRPLVLGVDVGGTNIRLASVDHHGDIGERHRHEARLSRHKAASAEESARFVCDTLEAAILPPLEAADDILAVGIGFPGFFDNENGTLLSSPNLPGLRDLALGKTLSGRLGLPVFVQNDASLAALGEFRFGLDQQAGSLLHLTLGTGIGGGVIIDGNLHTGDGGMAMEIGHLHVAPEDRTCGCGARGCMETWASASAVAARFAEATGKPADAREVCRLADTGNEYAISVLNDAGRVLGRGIAEAVKLLDIRQVSISGGLTGAWKHFAPSMHHELETRLLPPQVGKVELRRSSLGDDAGILGAAALALAGIQEHTK